MATPRRAPPSKTYTTSWDITQQRGQGVGKALIRSVYEQAKSAGASRVYWQTQASNEAGRALYDQVAKHLGFIVYSHETTGAA